MRLAARSWTLRAAAVLAGCATSEPGGQAPAPSAAAGGGAREAISGLGLQLVRAGAGRGVTARALAGREPRPVRAHRGDCTDASFPLPNVGVEEPEGVAGCPPGMAPISERTVCIDRWEAFVVEIVDGEHELAWSPYHRPDDRRFRAKSAPRAVPQGYMSQRQASQACANADKRLCTREEWEAACMGPLRRAYPYGDEEDLGACNGAREQSPVIEYFGSDAEWVWSELDHPCLSQLPAALARTGAYSRCITADGVFDLVGNLHEWIDDSEGTFRGGFYADTRRNGPGCHYETRAHDVEHWDYSTGFRCCAGD